VIGCGLHGAWTARCLAIAGFGPGVCFDPAPAAAAALADELSWSVGTREEAVRCGVVCCVTPGHSIVIDAGDLRPGRHLNMLGADGPGRPRRVSARSDHARCSATNGARRPHGGELTGAVEAGIVTRGRVTELGAVLAGDAAGRPGADAVDSVRLDRARDPGPRDRRSRARSLA